ncbi:secreted protein containing DUF490 [Candidatus Magnetomorum sp. HK-1]|nr:secreted protein containing DUF490 [Candidatus Magnetomorum sp. HK-1]
MKKIFKILLIITGITCFAVIVSLFSFIKYLESDHALKKVESLFNVHMKGKINFEKISINFFQPGITFHQMVMKSDNQTIIAGCEKVQIHVTFSHFFSDPIQIKQFLMVRPWLYLPITYQKPINFKRLGPFFSLIDCLTRRQLFSPVKTKESSSLIVDAVRLTDGIIYFSKNADQKSWRLEQVNINANEDKLNLSGNLSYAGLNSYPLQVFKLQTKGYYPPKRIAQTLIKTLTSKSPDILYERIQNIMTHLSFQSQGQISLLDELFKQIDPLSREISGNIIGNFHLNAQSNLPDLKMSLDYSGGHIHGIPLKSATFQAHAADNIITLNPINVQTTSGEINVQGLINLKKLLAESLLPNKINWNHLFYQFLIDSKNFPLTYFHPKISPETLLSGKISMKGKGLDRESFSSDITLDANTTLPEKFHIQSDSTLNIQAKAHIESNALTVMSLSAKTEGLSLTGHGNTTLDAHMISQFLVDIKSSGKWLKLLKLPEITGNIHTLLKIKKTQTETNADVQINGKKLFWEDYYLGNMVADGHISSTGRISINHATLFQSLSKLEAKGSLQLNSLSQWMSPPKKYDFLIDSNDIYLHSIHPALSGIVNIKGTVKGAGIVPVGNIKINGKDLILFGQKLSSVQIPVHFSDQELCLNSGEVEIALNEKITMDACINKQQKYSFEIISDPFKLSHIKWTIPQMEGQIRLNINGKGNLEQPQFNGDVTASQIFYRNQPLADAMIQVSSEKDFMTIKGQSMLNFYGRYHLKKHEFQLNAQATKMKLMPILAHLGFAELDGFLSGTATVKGQLNNIQNTHTQINIDRAAVTFNDRPLVWMNDFNLSIHNQLLTLSDYTIQFPKGGYCRGSLSGTFPNQTHLTLKSKIPLESLSTINDNIGDIQGNIYVDGTIQNLFNDPSFEGQARITDASFVLPWNNQRCHQIQGTLDASRHIFSLKQFSFRLDDGKCEIGGEMILSNRIPTNINLIASASALPIHIPDSFDVLLNANLKYSKKFRKSTLKGAIEFLEGLYYQELNVNKMLLDRIQNSNKPSLVKKFCKKFPEICRTTLDVNIKSRQPLITENDTAYLEIHPDLNVRGTLYNPVILGRAEMLNGEINYLSKNFVLEKGLIDFINPYRTEPIIDIKSNVDVRDWQISLDVLGKMDELQVKLNSIPPEEHGDIISILLFGKTTDRLFAPSTGPYKSTQQMIAELLSSAFEKDIKNTTGLDTFRLEALEHEAIDDKQTDDYKVTLGKELSRRMSITYAFETRNGQLIHHTIANYKILENLILRGMQDTQGIYGGELLFRMEFRQMPGFKYY